MPASYRRTETHAADARRTARSGAHIQREDVPWAINIPDHEPRTDSDAYRLARRLMHDIVGDVREFFLGDGLPYQDHHGGGLWVKDEDGWLLLKTSRE